MICWTQLVHRLSDKRQAQGLYMSIDRPSLQFATSVMMSGMSEPKVVHQLQVVRRGTVCSATSGRDMAVQLPSRPEDTVCVNRHGLGSGRADQEVCVVHCREVWQSHD